MAINFLNTVAVDDNVLFVDTINDRVGIGTDSPDSELDIRSDSSTAPVVLKLGNAVTSGNNGVIISQLSTFIDNSNIAANELGRIQVQNGAGSHDDGIMSFWTRDGVNNVDAARRMTINGLGRIGIGIDTPLHKLSIEAATTSALLKIRNTTNGAGAAIEFNDSGTDATTQNGTLTYYHSDSASQGGGSSFWFRGQPDTALVVGDGTNTGRVVVSGNSATEVGYGFYGDVNTGMFKPANHQLGFATNGTARLTITDTVATFSAVPIVGTQTAGDNSTYAASTAFVTAAVAAAPQGDITSVVAGTGLTGGGTSGAVTLNAIGGDGITANANDIAVDATVVRTTGSTMTGTLDFSGASIGRAITITADGTLDSSNASIYLGNAPTNYGFDIQYTGSASGNNNSLDIISTNAGSPVTALKILQSGATTFSSDATFEGNIEVDGEVVQTSTGGENQFASPLNMGSNEISDLADPTAPQEAATKAYVDNAVSAPTAPAAPTTVTTAVVGETIELTFNESATSDIDYYQVWSADPSGNFGIIAQITPGDFASTMTVVDTSFNVSGTISYRVYAVKLGIYSTAATSTQAFSASALSVTAMTVVSLNTAYYVQYEKPSSRFIGNIEIYMDSQATQAALNRSNASIVYSGQNASYMRSVGVSNNFHQFWVEVTTT